MSMYARNPVDETWYVHAPLKNERRSIVTAPPPSNIPYLNGISDKDGEQKPNNIWFKESDSDFIRLSKIGGRNDLLVHKQTTVRKEPAPYPIAQWWSDMQVFENSNDKPRPKSHAFQIPAWFAHEYSIKHQGNSQTVGDTKLAEKRTYRMHDINEPLKYGQLRNYLNPIRVSTKSSNIKQSKIIYNKPRIICV